MPRKKSSDAQKRQKNGTGSFYHRKDGYVEYRVHMGTKADGTAWRPSFSGKTEKEAKKAYDEWLKKPQNMPIDKAKTVSEWSLKWLEIYKGHLKKKSYKSYKNYELYVTKHINPEIGNMALGSVKPAHIKSLLNEKADLSKSALNYIEICLKDIFATAVENGLCEESPVKQKDFLSKDKVEKKPKSFSVVELPKIFAFAETHEHGSIVLALLYTGCREGEMAALMHSDNHAADGYITISKTIAQVEPDEDSAYMVGGKLVHRRKYDIKYTPKNEEDRTVALTPDGMEFFKALPKQNSVFLFPSRTGSFMTPNQIRRAYEKFFRDLNADLDKQRVEYLKLHPRAKSLDQFEHVRYLSPHKCRHTYGSRSVAAGINLRTIQEQLGHKRITTTQIYTDHTIDDRKNNVAKLKY